MMEHTRGDCIHMSLSLGEPQAQCARSATIWASGDPCFEIIGASSLHFICICKGYLDHVFVQDTAHLFELCYACDSKPSRIPIHHQILVRPVASTYQG